MLPEVAVHRDRGPRRAVWEHVLGQLALAGSKGVKDGVDIPPPCLAWGLQTHQHVLWSASGLLRVPASGLTLDASLPMGLGAGARSRMTQDDPGAFSPSAAPMPAPSA